MKNKLLILLVILFLFETENKSENLINDINCRCDFKDGFINSIYSNKCSMPENLKFIRSSLISLDDKIGVSQYENTENIYLFIQLEIWRKEYSVCLKVIDVIKLKKQDGINLLFGTFECKEKNKNIKTIAAYKMIENKINIVKAWGINIYTGKLINLSNSEADCNLPCTGVGCD